VYCPFRYPLWSKLATSHTHVKVFTENRHESPRVGESLRLPHPTLLGAQLDYRLVRPLVGEQRVSVRRDADGRLIMVGANAAITATATVSATGDPGPI